MTSSGTVYAPCCARCTGEEREQMECGMGGVFGSADASLRFALGELGSGDRLLEAMKSAHRDRLANKHLPDSALANGECPTCRDCDMHRESPGNTMRTGCYCLLWAADKMFCYHRNLHCPRYAEFGDRVADDASACPGFGRKKSRESLHDAG